MPNGTGVVTIIPASLTLENLKGARSTEMTLKQMLDKRSNGKAGSLLNGSDVPAGTKSITIVVAAIRESPEGFGAPAIIDLKTPIYGKSAWGVNKTNLKELIKLFGEDEQKLVGKKVKLEVISVRNPQTGEIVPSLAVSPRQVG
jgi:hypothetical protein